MGAHPKITPKGSLIFDLLNNFIVGGALIVLVSYVGTFVDPVGGAILWSYPFSLIPSLYFMKRQGKDRNYVGNFTMVGTFVIILEFIATFALAKLIKDSKSSDYLTISIMKSAGIWLIVGLLYYKLTYRYNLEGKFM